MMNIFVRGNRIDNAHKEYVKAGKRKKKERKVISPNCVFFFPSRIYKFQTESKSGVWRLTDLL